MQAIFVYLLYSPLGRVPSHCSCIFLSDDVSPCAVPLLGNIILLIRNELFVLVINLGHSVGVIGCFVLIKDKNSTTEYAYCYICSNLLHVSIQGSELTLGSKHEIGGFSSDKLKRVLLSSRCAHLAASSYRFNSEWNVRTDISSERNAFVGNRVCYLASSTVVALLRSAVEYLVLLAFCQQFKPVFADE